MRLRSRLVLVLTSHSHVLVSGASEPVGKSPVDTFFPFSRDHALTYPPT